MPVHLLRPDPSPSLPLYTPPLEFRKNGLVSWEPELAPQLFSGMYSAHMPSRRVYPGFRSDPAMMTSLAVE